MCRKIIYFYSLISLFSLPSFAITHGELAGPEYQNVGGISTYIRGRYESPANSYGFIRDRNGPLKIFNSDRCLATRIADQILITAAHCLMDKTQLPVDGVDFSIEGQTFSSHTFKIHPQYRIDPILNVTSEGMLQYDLAIILLDESDPQWNLNLPSFLIPLHEVARDQQVLSIGKRHVEIFHKGKPTTLYTDNSLRMKANFTISDVYDDVAWKKLNLFDKFTTFTKNNTSTIREGDSGGPSFMIENSVHYLVGIHSMVISCRDCRPDWINIDTSVYQHRDWVQKTIQELTQ